MDTYHRLHTPNQNHFDRTRSLRAQEALQREKWTNRSRHKESDAAQQARAKREEEKQSLLEKLLYRVVSKPKDHARAAAHHAAKTLPNYVVGIKNFQRVVRNFCRIQLKSQDSYVIEQYILTRMEQLAKSRRIWPLKRMGPTVLKRLAADVVEEIRARIVFMAENTPPLRVRLPQNRMVTQARINGPATPPCFIVYVQREASISVVALTSSGKFRKRQCTKLRTQDDEDYRNDARTRRRQSRRRIH